MDPRVVRGVRTLAVILPLVCVSTLGALAQAANPLGEWNLQSDAQGQITKFTLTITKVGEALKGKVVSEAYGTQDLTDLKFENATVTFTRNLDLGGQTIPMVFKGKIEGDKMTGAYTVQEFEIPVTGTRKTFEVTVTGPSAPGASLWVAGGESHPLKAAAGAALEIVEIEPK